MNGNYITGFFKVYDEDSLSVITKIIYKYSYNKTYKK